MEEREKKPRKILLARSTRNIKRKSERGILYGGLIMFDDEYYEDDYTPDYDWREEEWYALTDGQYGDYPGGDIDYDALGFGD